MPDDLEQLVAFLNTVDVDEGTDELGDAAGATRWAVGRGLLPEGAALSTDELAQARALRSTLRRLAVAHHEGHVDEEAIAEFDAIAGALPLRATVDGSGQVGLGPGRDGTPALAQLVGALVIAAATERWPRVKLCPAEDCRWAFVDQSKNRSRRWCAMGVCGNRQKTRSYRERQREQRE